MISPSPTDRDLKSPARPVKARNLALGIERIGFFALSHQALCAIVFVILSAIAAVGFVRVKVDDSLSQLFKSETEEFRTYDAARLAEHIADFSLAALGLCRPLGREGEAK